MDSTKHQPAEYYPQWLTLLWFTISYSIYPPLTYISFEDTKLKNLVTKLLEAWQYDCMTDSAAFLNMLKSVNVVWMTSVSSLSHNETVQVTNSFTAKPDMYYLTLTHLFNNTRNIQCPREEISTQLSLKDDGDLTQIKHQRGIHFWLGIGSSGKGRGFGHW